MFVVVLRYGCEGCDTTWQQIPPHRTDITVHIKDDIIYCKKNLKRSSDYKCGKCGKPKKGHICNMISTYKEKPINDLEKDIVNNLVRNTFHPPTHALQQGMTLPVPFSQFSDIELPPLRSFKEENETN